MCAQHSPKTDPFEIEVISKKWVTQQDLTDDALRYRKIRLSALQTSPEAFGSTFEREHAFPTETWEMRLQNEDANLVVVTKREDSEDTSEGEKKDWLGMVVAIKQKKSADRFLDDYLQNPSWTVRYYLAGTFVHPSIRLNGLARRLIKKVIEVIGLDARKHGLASATVELQVYESNVGAVKVYTECGFKKIRSESEGIAVLVLDMEID